MGSTNVSGTETVQDGVKEGDVATRIIPLRGSARSPPEPWSDTGAHGGGDRVMLDEIFVPHLPADKYHCAADERVGAASCLVGVAANRCFDTGLTVNIADQVPGLDHPSYAPLPSRTAPLPMPDTNAKRI